MSTIAASTIPMVAAAASPKLASGSDDELVELGRQFDALSSTLDHARQRAHDLTNQLEAQSPPRPEVLRRRPADYNMLCWGNSLGRGTDQDGYYWPGVIEDLRGRSFCHDVARAVAPQDSLSEGDHTIVSRVVWPEAKMRADEIIAAYDAWKAQHDVLDREIGAADAWGEHEHLLEQLYEVEHSILNVSATTIEGLRVKARVACWYRQERLDNTEGPAGDPEWDDQVAWRVIEDLMQMADGAPSEVVRGAELVV